MSTTVQPAAFAVVELGRAPGAALLVASGLSAMRQLNRPNSILGFSFNAWLRWSSKGSIRGRRCCSASWRLIKARRLSGVMSTLGNPSRMAL